MRRAAAIIAAVLSVFPGGPLRCPCQLAALFENRAATVLIPQPAPADDEAGGCENQRCSCKTHREPAGPEPTEKTPAPGVPCQHCPNIDLVLPVVTGERLASDRDPGDSPGASLASDTAVPLTHRPDTLTLVGREFTSSAPDRLRYCHSFRC